MGASRRHGTSSDFLLERNLIQAINQLLAHYRLPGLIRPAVRRSETRGRAYALSSTHCARHDTNDWSPS
jgi:hypothetical protein